MSINPKNIVLKQKIVFFVVVCRATAQRRLSLFYVSDRASCGQCDHWWGNIPILGKSRVWGFWGGDFCAKGIFLGIFCAIRNSVLMGFHSSLC